MFLRNVNGSKCFIRNLQQWVLQLNHAQDNLKKEKKAGGACFFALGNKQTLRTLSILIWVTLQTLQFGNHCCTTPRGQGEGLESDAPER